MIRKEREPLDPGRIRARFYSQNIMEKIMAVHLTYNIVRDQIEKLIDTYPNKINPVDDDVCVYTDRYDPDKHCIIGQWLTNNGFYCPGPDVKANIAEIIIGDYSPFDRNKICESVQMDKLTIEFLDSVQRKADHGGIPIPWGEIEL